MSSILVVIPARLASNRLPNKPLLDIGGQPLLAYPVRAAQESGFDWTVATSDREIAELCDQRGWKCFLQEQEFATGTDRCADVYRQSPQYRTIINLQCDEWMARPADLVALRDALQIPFSMATLCRDLRPREADNHSCVKVVCGVLHQRPRPLYFSRAPMAGAKLHIGIYAYTPGSLLITASQPQTRLELAESLEQLRPLERGIFITAVQVDGNGFAINTRDDLSMARMMAEQGLVTVPGK